MRRFLLVVLFALSATAFAQGRTLACSTDVSTRFACYLEQPVIALGAFEVSIGIDTLAAGSSHVAPYLAGSYYASTWSFTVEYALPSSFLFGRPNPWRVSFVMRF